MKKLIVFGILVLPFLVFQNCGSSTQGQNFADPDSALSASQCDEGNCVSAAELLWLKIREFNPYHIEYTTLDAGHFNIGGLCGTGNYQSHRFQWIMYESFGAGDVVAEGETREPACLNGRFVLPIVPNKKVVTPDSRYNLILELVGISNDGEIQSNPLPNNQGTLDIIFTTDPP